MSGKIDPLFEDHPEIVQRKLQSEEFVLALRIEQDFRAGDLSPMDAIERLERLGVQPKEAEAMVDRWESAVYGAEYGK